MAVAFEDARENYSLGTLEESGEDVLEKLERLILEHVPGSIAETISMIDVLIPNVEAGSRADGADIRALHNIRGFLETRS